MFSRSRSTDKTADLERFKISKSKSWIFQTFESTTTHAGDMALTSP
jgi:hypothetical protein